MASVLESHRCFALRTKHEGKYLQTVSRKKEGGNLVEASADAVAGNARTRFCVEPSKYEDGLVHVRCCYNNKYWVPLKDSGSRFSRWVIGTADEPKEDTSSDACTLFGTFPVGGHDDSIRFFHTRLQKYVVLSSVDDVAKPYMQLEGYQDYVSGVCTVIGLSQQKELPKYIAFKQSDGNYLGMKLLRDMFRESLPAWVRVATVFGGVSSLMALHATTEMASAALGDARGLVFYTKDKAEEGVMCTVFTNDDGTVRIKSHKAGFWRRDGEGNIVAHDVETSDSDPDTLFKVIPGDKDRTIALENLGNNKICKIRRDHPGFEFLKAEESSLSHFTQLQYDESFHTREITDVKFHLEEARIYDTKLDGSDVISNTNDDKHTGLEYTFTFTEKREKTIKWQNSVSETTDLEKSITIGAGGNLPIVLSGQVTLSRQTTSTKVNEEAQTVTEETTRAYKKTILPLKTMSGQLVWKRSSCDVPYSYRQYVRLTNADKVTSTHDDGIYTVHNNYDFDTIFSETPEGIKKKVAEKYPGLRM